MARNVIGGAEIGSHIDGRSGARRGANLGLGATLLSGSIAAYGEYERQFNRAFRRCMRISFANIRPSRGRTVKLVLSFWQRLLLTVLVMLAVNWLTGRLSPTAATARIANLPSQFVFSL